MTDVPDDGVSVAPGVRWFLACGACRTYIHPPISTGAVVRYEPDLSRVPNTRIYCRCGNSFMAHEGDWRTGGENLKTAIRRRELGEGQDGYG